VTSKKLRGHNGISGLAYVPAVASFIPLLGVGFGIAAILWGASKWRGGGKPVAYIGAAGIAFTVLLYGSLFAIGIRWSDSDEFLEAQLSLSQARLTEIMKSVEVYRLTHGEYPDSLHALDEGQGIERNYGDTTVGPAFSFRFWEYREPQSEFYYSRLEDGSRYHLFGIGLDGEPFTDDDVYPLVPAGDADGLGIILPNDDSQ